MTTPPPSSRQCRCACGCNKPAYVIDSAICTRCLVALQDGDRRHEDPEEGWI